MASTFVVYRSTAVAQIGSTPLVFVPESPDQKVALNFYNSNVAARTVTVAMVGGKTMSFSIDPDTPETVLVDLTGDLTVTASGTGVFGWLARR